MSQSQLLSGKTEMMKGQEQICRSCSGNFEEKKFKRKNNIFTFKF